MTTYSAAEFIRMSIACKEVVSIKEMGSRLLKNNIMPIMYLHLQR